MGEIYICVFLRNVTTGAWKKKTFYYLKEAYDYFVVAHNECLDSKLIEDEIMYVIFDTACIYTALGKSTSGSVITYTDLIDFFEGYMDDEEEENDV